jgi:tripartite-type tricarboxylate transporter receptor subunit TctC
MYKKLPFDTVKSFEPVMLTHVVPLVMAVNNDVPAKTVSEAIAYFKANPGKLSYGSSGNGGAPHMSAELFKTVAGVDLTHVPYKGSTAAHPDLIAGRVVLMFDTVAAIAPQVKGGKVRGLAVTTSKRSSALPDLPTMTEAGVKGYDTSTWGGLLAPAGTPKDVIAKLNAEANKALAAPDVKAQLGTNGIEPAGGTPQQFSEFIAAEMTRWAKVAKAAGVEPE